MERALLFLGLEGIGMLESMRSSESFVVEGL